MYQSERSETNIMKKDILFPARNQFLYVRCIHSKIKLILFINLDI